MKRCIFCFPNAFQFAVLFALMFTCLASEISYAQDKKNDEAEFDVLFDGTSLENFRGYAQEKITGWEIVDGVLHASGKGGDIISREMYENFELRLEWKATKAANSGIMYCVQTGDKASYFTGPEYQILDDDGHDVAADDTISAGGLYALYKPKNKKLNPVGEWNEAKIIVNNHVVEHWLNGTKLLEADMSSKDWRDRVANSKFKQWKKFGVNPVGHICLQEHGNEMWFRNIRIKRIPEVLFDGTSMDNFRGYKTEEIGKGWKIVGDVLEFDGTKKSGDIITKKEYENFDLTFDWKVTEGANSGIMYRVSLGDQAPYLSGPEFQILDDGGHKDGKKEVTSVGSLYALYKPKEKQINAVGEWNTARIVIKGDLVQHYLNGRKVVQATFGSNDWNERVAASKFKTWEKFGKNKSGHIAFQDHGNRVFFRNIKIVSLPDTEAEAKPADKASIKNPLTRAVVVAEKIKMKTLGQACKMYMLQTGRFPEKLIHLCKSPEGAKKYNGPYLDPSVLKDGKIVDRWGNEYQFETSQVQQTIKIVSNGPDGKPGTNDDISK